MSLGVHKEPKFWTWVLNMRLHARLGVAAAVIGSCGITAGLTSLWLPHRQTFVWGGSIGLLIAGLLLLRRPTSSEAEELSSATVASDPAASSSSEVARPEYSTSVFTRRYWGWVILGCAMAALAAPPRNKPVVVQAKEPAAPVRKKVAPPPAPATNPPVAGAPAEPVKFPPLRLQGVHLLPGHPAAIINGKTCVPGEVIAGVSIVEIDRDSVTVEFSGEQRRLVLGKDARPRSSRSSQRSSLP